MSGAVRASALTSTDRLAGRLTAPNVRVIDASFFLPFQKRDARAEFETRRIPGAVFFDIDAISDRTTFLPHMLPRPENFGSAVGALGISNNDEVVVYDALGGTQAAARVWWTFRVFGHDCVSVLDGGLPKWLAEGRPTEAGPAAPRPAMFRATFRPELVRSVEHMIANVGSRRDQVVDARSHGRFAGTDPEPRPAKKAGHIPGSRNVPAGALLDPTHNFVFRSDAEIAKAFADAGLDATNPVVASCGSGVTASVLAFGLYLLGQDKAAVYDGSWAEWGNRDDTPVER
ncbi:MAG: 3-mercaptopyruvate sulfurtransferase [Rhodospirillales bacterium]|nr:3-mercaptopyruvate sulfurtransferase [Rhodospirillales bacterium]